MKNKLLKNMFTATILLLLSCFLVNSAAAGPTLTVKVLPKPKGVISATSGTTFVSPDTYICHNDTAYFALGNLTPTGIYGAELDTAKGTLKGWSVAAGGSIVSVDNRIAKIVFTNTGASNQTVRITAYIRTVDTIDGIADLCLNDTTFDIIVLPKPVMTFADLPNTNTVCEGNASLNAYPLTITQTTPAGTDGTVRWAFDSATIGITAATVSGLFNERNPSVYFTNSIASGASGTIDVVLYYTDKDGVCEKEVDRKRITVYATPEILTESIFRAGVAGATSACHKDTLGLAVTFPVGTTFASWGFVQVDGAAGTNVIPTAANVTVTFAGDSVIFTNTGTANAYIRIKANYTNTECGPGTDSLTQIITVFPQITVDLAAAINCARTTSGTDTVEVTVKAAGGCSSATGYTVVLGYDSNLEVAAGQSGVTDNSGTHQVTITLTMAEATGAGKMFKIIVPATGKGYDITTVSATTTGAGTDPCVNCTETVFN